MNRNVTMETEFCQEQEAFEEFNKLYSYTNEDLARTMTDVELKELCLRVKCRVEMDRWNPVYDMQRIARKQGRLKNKSKKKEISFLKKCVNRYKPGCLYAEEEMRNINLEEWRQRKKFNILRLDLWKYDREKAEKTKYSQIDSSESATINVVSEQSEQMEIVDLTTVDNNGKQLEEKEVFKRKLNDLIGNSEPSETQHFMTEFFDVNTESIELGTQSMEVNAEEGVQILLYASEDIIETQPVSVPSIGMSQDIPHTEYSEFNRRVHCSSTQDINILITS